jgi:hypothetical protein
VTGQARAAVPQDTGWYVTCPGSDRLRDAVACLLFTSSRSRIIHASSRGRSSDLLTLKFAYAVFICSYSVDHTPEWQNRITSTYRNPLHTFFGLCTTFFFHGATDPSGPGPPHYRGFTITLDRTPLDERSGRRKDLYLTTHKSHNRQTSMPAAGFEPTILASERPQTHALDRAATGIKVDV